MFFYFYHEAKYKKGNFNKHTIGNLLASHSGPLVRKKAKRKKNNKNDSIFVTVLSFRQRNFYFLSESNSEVNKYIIYMQYKSLAGTGGENRRIYKCLNGKMLVVKKIS